MFGRVASFFRAGRSARRNASGVTLHRVLGEGSFVLAMSEGRFGQGDPTAFFDLFRVEDGKIVEHWDTISTIPPRSEWKNDNGKF